MGSTETHYSVTDAIDAIDAVDAVDAADATTRRWRARANA